MNSVILSIFIPAYNRLYKLKDTLEIILGYSNDDIEVIISDDSTDELTCDYVNSICDSRVIYYKRKDLSWVCSLSIAKGLYYLQILDKDSITSTKDLEVFISFLHKHKEITYGRCRLPYDKRINGMECVLYRDSLEAFDQMSYRVLHPSGRFFNKCLLQEIMEKHSNKLSIDEIIAEMLLHGNAAIYQNPLILTETKGESWKRESSYASADVNTLFFSPNKREERYKIWAIHLLGLDVSTMFKIKILNDMTFRAINGSTYGYRDFLSNRVTCKHYGIAGRKLSLVEMAKISLSMWLGIYFFTIKKYRFRPDQYTIYTWNMIYKEISFIVKLFI